MRTELVVPLGDAVVPLADLQARVVRSTSPCQRTHQAVRMTPHESNWSTDKGLESRIVAEWTVILTAVGAAGATGWFGYLGIRRSTDVTMKQIAEETARAHEQIQAENERLRAQHREDHLRNRQGTYHALLSADQELEKAILGTGDAQEAFAKFSHLGNGTAIFGTESVQVAITAILAQYVEVFREAKKRAGDTTTSADVQTVYKEHAQRIVAARTALAEAMREDVGPQ